MSAFMVAPFEFKQGSRTLLACALALFSGESSSPASPPAIHVRPGAHGVEVSWPAVQRGPDDRLERPWFELQRSADLQTWEPFGERIRAGSSTPEDILTQRVSPSANLEFYRLLVVPQPQAAKLGDDGAEVFGYADAFREEYERIGPISPEKFEAQFALRTSYRDRISWDPRTANYWEAFNADPEVLNQAKEPDQPGYRHFDARLNPAELEIFLKNGFVVSERLGDRSFAETFFKLWHADLPVFISTDAILQAWHRTYDAMLEELEETQLYAAVEALLGGLAGQCAAAATEIPAGNPVLRESLQDADYFLTVARSLLTGQSQPGAFGQAERVATTLSDINAEQLKRAPEFMGHCRIVDFSQFRPRGHYTHSDRLTRYFKCLMWLGRMDVPIAGEFERCYNDKRPASPREIGFSIVLWHLLQASRQLENWRQIEETIAAFVGPTDSLTFGGLGGLLAGAGIDGLSDVTDLGVIERLRDAIEAGSLGVQNIRSDWFDGNTFTSLPRTFTVLGQKFLPDSWTMSQTVFPALENRKERRVPGALDVAFSILGNDQIVPELRAQMEGRFAETDRPHALSFRDGYGHQRSLAAVRATMERLTPAAWQGNISTDWLRALSELSAPTTAPGFPEAMQTRAWAMKTLNTQLASWTHLRHDTILYAKQSYTLPFQCLFPSGYVEPRGEFWRALRLLALRTAEIVGRLRVSGGYPTMQHQPEIRDPQTDDVIQTETWVPIQVPLSDIRARQVAHLEGFADIVKRLESLVAKQFSQDCFTPEDERFIDSLMIHQANKGGGCGNPRWVEYTGWYPALFYRAIHWGDTDFHAKYGAGAFDALVADIHTDLPSPDSGDPGSVLHQGVGRVNLLMLAVEQGGDRIVCAGPVLSHYEFEVIGEPRRLIDSEWAGGGEGTRNPNGILQGAYPGDVPATRFEGLRPPVWTRGFLVPAH